MLIMKSLNYCIACLAGVGLMGTPVNKLVRGPRKVRICNMGKGAKSKVKSFKAQVGGGFPERSRDSGEKDGRI
jgi:hypothetical protein